MLMTHPNAPKTMQFGVHLMIDGYMANPEALADADALEELLGNLPGEMGMYPICKPTVVSVGPNCTKDPGGLSGFIMIAESHISFHTFPGRRFVTMDLYTCQNDLDTEGTAKRLMNAFSIEDADIYVQKRGIRYPADNVPEAVVAAE